MISKFQKLFKYNTHKSYEITIILVTLFFIIEKIIDENHHTVLLLYNTLNQEHNHDNEYYSDNLLYSFEKMLRSHVYDDEKINKIDNIYSTINHITREQDPNKILPTIQIAKIKNKK